MLARLDPKQLERIWFPLGEQDKADDAREAERAGLAAARARREPGGVLPRRRRLPRVPRHGTGSRRAPARSSTSTGRELGSTTASGGSRPGQRKGIGVSAATPLYVLDTDSAANTVVVGPRESLARRRVARVAAASTSTSTARRREAPLPLAGGRGARVAEARRLRARARRAGLRRRARAGRRSLRRRRRRGLRSRLVRRPTTKIGAGCSSPHSRGGTSGDSRSQSSSSPSGSSFAYLLVRLGGTVGRLSAFITGAEREVLPVINKVGGSVDRVNGQLDKVDQITDSAVDAADSVDTAVRAVSMAVTRPVQKVSGLRGRRHATAPPTSRRGATGGTPCRRARKRRRVASRSSLEELRDAGDASVSDEITLVAPGAGGLPPRSRTSSSAGSASGSS